MQALGAVAALAGPGIGGLLLTMIGPWAAFGTAFLVGIAAIVPLLHIDEPPVMRTRPDGAYAAATNAVRLYFADGWIQVSVTTAWSIVMFQGSAVAMTASAARCRSRRRRRCRRAGARAPDRQRSRAPRAVANAAVLAAGLVLRSVTFGHAAAVVAVAVGTTMLRGLYLPSWMTPVYNEAKISPCVLRFQFAAEGGWDVAAHLPAG